VLKNIVGFIPLGFCLQACFSQFRHYRRSALVTVIVGFIVSLIIEVLQVLLPMRASGMMDLITNTLGTLLGILAYRAMTVRVRCE
jgi:glycopeptide antibiotics resistance protein